MPLTSKGKEILGHMENTYGSEAKAKEVFYRSKNAGTISGVDAIIADRPSDSVLNWASGNREFLPAEASSEIKKVSGVD